ncbi:MAG: helix-turn-helix transcriptional regulator [Planctomycetota bacterium]
MKNLARYEQFLRILALLDLLAAARGPLDDQALIAALKERLGLSRLSPRTLHRDCEFLITCGYPINHSQLPGDRKFGWRLDTGAIAGRKIPPEPLTLLEIAAFNVGRDLLRVFEGTVLWTGIESLRAKLESDLPPELRTQAEESRRVFHVPAPDAARYAERPRLLSALSRAISDCREIEVEAHPGERVAASPRRLRPVMLVVSLPRIQLAAWDITQPQGDPPVLIDLDRIAKVTSLDTRFTPQPIDPGRLVEEG